MHTANNFVLHELYNNGYLFVNEFICKKYLSFTARPCQEHADAILENFENELKDTGTRTMIDPNITKTEIDSTKPDDDNQQSNPDDDKKTINPHTENQQSNPDDDKNNTDHDSSKLKDTQGEIKNRDDEKKNDINPDLDKDEIQLQSSVGHTEVGHTTVENTETGEQIKLVLKVENEYSEKAIAESGSCKTDIVRTGHAAESDKSDSTDEETVEHTVSAEISARTLPMKDVNHGSVQPFQLSTDCTRVVNTKKHTGLKGKPSNPPRRRSLDKQLINAESQSGDKTKNVNVEVSTGDHDDRNTELKSDVALLDVTKGQVDGPKKEEDTDDTLVNENKAAIGGSSAEPIEDTEKEPVVDVDATKNEDENRQSKSQPNSDPSGHTEKRRISESTKKKRKERQEAIQKGKFEVEQVSVIDLLSSDEEKEVM